MYRFFQKYDLQSPRICGFLLLVVPAVGSRALIEGPSSNPNLLRTYAIFYTTLISSVVFYRLSPFHPLAKYPGPVLAKVSNLWFVSIYGSALECSGLTPCPIQGAPRLARKAACPLHEPPREIRRRRSCGYVRFTFGDPNSFDPNHKRHTRPERNNAQRRVCNCTASRAGRLGQGDVYVATVGTFSAY